MLINTLKTNKFKTITLIWLSSNLQKDQKPIVKLTILKLEKSWILKAQL